MLVLKELAVLYGLLLCGYKIKYIQEVGAVFLTDLWVSDDEFEFVCTCIFSVILFSDVNIKNKFVSSQKLVDGILLEQISC